jgi:hypothetical protein
MISLGGLVSQKAFGKFEMGKVISNPFANAFIKEGEGEDHEVSMANNSIDTIIKMATELKAKMGEDEKQIPAWIQDHIAKAENLISQASGNYHEYGDSNENITNEGRSVKKIQTDYTKIVDTIQTELELYKKHKDTPNAKKHVDNLKKLNDIKKKLAIELDNSVTSLYKDVELKVEAKKYDIGAGHMGNGLTIWNRAEEQYGDYKIIAHIDPNGKISIRDKGIPSNVMKMIDDWASAMKKGNK